MKYEGLSSRNRLELQVFRLLGINQFRKIVLSFEKAKHHKSNRKNENYHPSNLDVFSFERYNGFLFYNAFLHCVSLVLTVTYIVITLAYKVRMLVFDVLIVILSIFNLYCIVLQRYNHLRIKEYCHRYYNRFYEKASSYSEELIDNLYTGKPQLLQTDYEVICRIRNAFEGREDCVLDIGDIDSLKRICDCIRHIPQRTSNQRSKEVVEVGLIEKCTSTSGPYTSLQMRVEWLQRKLRHSERRILGRAVIVTEDMNCEKYYREIVPEDTAYNFCFVSILLYEVFADAVDKVRANEA